MEEIKGIDVGGKEKSGYQWWQQQGMRVQLPEAKGAHHGLPTAS